MIRKDPKRFHERGQKTSLDDFARTIEKMNSKTLERLRAECVQYMPEPGENDIFLEIIDGNFALREIRELPN